MTAIAKVCPDCGGSGSFGVDNSKPDRLARLCRPCSATRQKTWCHANPEKVRARSIRSEAKRRGKRRWVDTYDTRASVLRRMYGITPERYDEMLAEQDGTCALCRNPETRRRKGTLCRLAVDHDHVTGKVRGLLCTKCNRTEGMVGSLDRARALVTYLERYA